MRNALILAGAATLAAGSPVLAQRAAPTTDSGTVEGKITPPDSGIATPDRGIARPGATRVSPGGDPSAIGAANAPTEAGKPSPTTQAPLAAPAPGGGQPDQPASHEPPPPAGGSTPN
jgi:hypothetical protein